MSKLKLKLQVTHQQISCQVFPFLNVHFLILQTTTISSFLRLVGLKSKTTFDAVMNQMNQSSQEKTQPNGSPRHCTVSGSCPIIVFVDFMTSKGCWWATFGPVFLPCTRWRRLWFDTNCLNWLITRSKSGISRICWMQKPYGSWQLSLYLVSGNRSSAPIIPLVRCLQLSLNCRTNPGVCVSVSAKTFSLTAQYASPIPQGPRWNCVTSSRHSWNGINASSRGKPSCTRSARIDAS